MSEAFSLRDHLFNAGTLGQLSQEFAQAIPGFDPGMFLDRVLPQLPELALLRRLDAIADAIEAQLPSNFHAMAEQLEMAMPPPLDPTRQDNDFGHFIHAVPGILAVRHGLENHRDRALDLLHSATKRFSMEFYIRPFLDRWPKETLARLWQWSEDSHYHVRRLVSEGTRPRLPWAKSIGLDPLVPLDLLEKLHADPTRYVTRSVANHLNDITKINTDAVLARLRKWRVSQTQQTGELDWMIRHALRTQIKKGHLPTLELLGFDVAAPVMVQVSIDQTEIARGDPLDFEVTLGSDRSLPVLVDFVIWFRKADGALSPKVFKLKQADLTPNQPLVLRKRHILKWDATTFRLYPGAHRLSVQVNGRIRAEAGFALLG